MEPSRSPRYAGPTVEPLPRYVPQSEDTTEAVDRMLFEHWRRLSVLEKAELLRDLCRSLHEHQIAGLAARHPTASSAELEDLAARARLGPDLYARADAARRALR